MFSKMCSGAEVPVHVRVDCTTDAGRTGSRQHIIPVRVHKSPPPAAASDPIRILYLSSSPSDQRQIRVNAELRTIVETMRLGDGRDGFQIFQHGATRTKDISHNLLQVRPHIVHFSGHSASDGTFQVENEAGRSAPLPVAGTGSTAKLQRRQADAARNEQTWRCLPTHTAYPRGTFSNLGGQEQGR